MCWPLEWSSWRNSLTWSLILSSGSSSNMQMSTIWPLSLSISFRTRCVMTIKACLLTWFCSSCKSLKMSLVRSFRLLGNLLNKSPSEIMILALTPKSILDSSIWNMRSRFSIQIFWLTHMNLHRAKTADLSRMHISGACCCSILMLAAPLTVYLFLAAYAIFKIGSRNLPRRPS